MITSLVALAAFAVALPMLLLAGAAARRLGLLDRPDERKRHLGDVPLAGGLGLYAALVTTIVGVELALAPTLSIDRIGSVALGVGLLALLLGLVDDALDLDAKPRLACQVAIALLPALAFDVRVATLGDVLGTGPIAFGPAASIAFTTFCLVGALNAANMIDGLDGLLASLVASSLATLTLLALIVPARPELLCVVTVGALAAFLVLNLGIGGERRRVFLGDAGSTLLGVLLAVPLIGYSQGPGAPIEPVVAGWLLGLPLLDTTVVLVRRVLEGRSPLQAGRDHLHHLLQDDGRSARGTLLVMVGAHAGMLAVGVAAQLSPLPPWAFLYGFVALTLLHFAVTGRLARRIERASAPRREAPPPAVRAGEESPGDGYRAPAADGVPADEPAREAAEALAD